MVGAEGIGLNCCSGFRIFIDQSTQHMVVTLSSQVAPHCNEVKIPGLFLQDHLQLIRMCVLLFEFLYVSSLPHSLYLFWDLSVSTPSTMDHPTL